MSGHYYERGRSARIAGQGLCGARKRRRKCQERQKKDRRTKTPIYKIRRSFTPPYTLWGKLESGALGVPDIGKGKMQADPSVTINWKWDEPCWPLQDFKSRAASIGLLQIRRRCILCGFTFVGPAGIPLLQHHFAQCHKGKPLQYVAYPVSYGLVPKGGDA